jgi:tRNA threonylcarbamoyladenosine biosynthesis protein TsaB
VKLLCLDTSTDACSVALGLAPGQVISEHSEEPRVHARRVLGMVDAVLARGGVSPGQLDAIAVGCGPGSFTGVRIGCAVAQGLAFAAGLPVVPLSSLAMLAARHVEQARDWSGECGECGERDGVAAPLAATVAGPTGAVPQDIVLVAQDARMGEVYWAAYDARGGVPALRAPLVPDRLDAPVALAAALAGPPLAGAVVRAAGSAFALAPVLAGLDLDPAIVRAQDLPRAADALALAAAQVRAGGAMPPERAVPVYFRSPV